MPLLVAVTAVLLFRAIIKKREVQPFLLSFVLFVLAFVGLAISLFPNIIPPDISYVEAAAPVKSLKFLLVGAAILIPLILVYTAYGYWVFRGKIRGDEGYH